MNAPKINPLHLFLTLLTTITSVALTVMVLIIADSVFSDPITATRTKFLTKLITIETVVFIITMLVLWSGLKKINKKDPPKAFSYMLTMGITLVLFLAFVCQPVYGLVRATPADAEIPMDIGKANDAIRDNFFKKNHLSDSVTSEQLTNLMDSLGRGWGRKDSLPATVSVGQEKAQLSVNITVSKPSFEVGEPIILYITITNNSNTIQKVLFDKPGLITDPLWRTTVTVTDDKTQKSVLKYANRAVLISQAYTEDQLKKNYYTLNPGQSISSKRELSMLVIYSTPDNELPKGDYTVRLSYYENVSNALTIKVK